MPHHQREELKEDLDKILQNKIISLSTSSWTLPVIEVKKKDGSIRFCVDYQKLNQVTLNETYPIPKIEESLNELGGVYFFTKLDLKSGFWQFAIEKASQEKTAFICLYGTFKFNICHLS